MHLNLPELPFKQVIKHYHHGSEILVIEIMTQKSYNLNNKENSEIAIEELKSNTNKYIYYLNVPYEYIEFEKARIKGEIVNLLGLFNFVIAAFFFTMYVKNIPFGLAQKNNVVSLIISLPFSYIGCMFLVKLCQGIKEHESNYKKKFFL